MTRALSLTFVAAASLSTACPTDHPDRGRCEQACDVAVGCGFLPSTLGGAPGDSNAEMRAECVERCAASEQTDPVESILGCLADQDGLGACAVDQCKEALRCLPHGLTEGIVGAPEVTFRLIDGVIFSTLFQHHVCGKLPDTGLPLPPPEEITQLCDDSKDPCAAPPGATERTLRLPLCRDDACDDLAHDNCDPRLCSYDPAPTFDCADYGIESVQFGYFDEREVLHLDPTLYTCAQAGEGQVVPDITARAIYPVALFNGHLTARLVGILDVPATAVDRPYCWLSHPSHPLALGWLVHAGSTTIPVPAPSSAELAADIGDDPDAFPRGCSCTNDLLGCEDNGENKNCDNGVDDDLDGLIDAEDPGCKP